MRILIVEDEGIQAMALEDTLERNGYTVAGVSDHGMEAVEMIRNDRIDLVILDVNIKGKWDGIETARQIQAVKKIPFIYLTAYMDDVTHQRADDTNPEAYLNKPYQEAKLLAAVEKALTSPAYCTDDNGVKILALYR
ncbi:response regulator [Dyadobacter psychrotolerans]|uniref:Response regulator n=1 Tax=Dyadobacter psychrotolerans TaxID=2541721 RepID=A0A4V2Z461_9BACT|nr:response regulator [Dyadobacter psychrotolerans]TDE15418.1 response regulator [Dyadobacter psychrotolerans]